MNLKYEDKINILVALLHMKQAAKLLDNQFGAVSKALLNVCQSLIVENNLMIEDIDEVDQIKENLKKTIDEQC